VNGDDGFVVGYGPSGTPGGYGIPVVPPYQGPPDLQSQYNHAVVMRDACFRAYMKAVRSGKEYTAEGMNLKRYDLTALRTEYIFWRDTVDNIVRNGNTSTMVWKHIIPFY
jgi:hypothetical protein